jgi:hypothetical protein
VSQSTTILSMCQSSTSATNAGTVNQCSTSLPSVPVLVSPGFDIWIKAGPAKRYFNVMMTVCVTDGISAIRRITAEYGRKQMHFNAVCLATCHGHERKPCVRWSSSGHLTLTQTAVKAVAKITSRVHIITCWQGLFLDKISVPGVVLSGYNTWMNSYGEVDGVSIEPEPWQLQYICCGLPIDNAVEHYDAIGRSCKGRCRAEPGKLVIRLLDNKLVTI